jgi:hypothetical protein
MRSILLFIAMGSAALLAYDGGLAIELVFAITIWVGLVIGSIRVTRTEDNDQDQ